MGNEDLNMAPLALDPYEIDQVGGDGDPPPRLSREELIEYLRARPGLRRDELDTPEACLLYTSPSPRD